MSSYFEGMPMALLETMAARVVPVVTRDCSMVHILENGINVLFVEKQNSEDLCEKLKDIMSSPELYARL